MATIVKNQDMFKVVESPAEQGSWKLLLCAVNQTRTHMDGSKIKPSELGRYGSMSAGTSLQMIKRYPKMQKWWAETVRDSDFVHGVKIWDTRVRGHLDAGVAIMSYLDLGVAVIKDEFWQEAPQDEARIMEFARQAYSEVKRMMDEGCYNETHMPLLGAGYGRVSIYKMLALVAEMDLPKNVFVYYLEDGVNLCYNANDY